MRLLETKSLALKEFYETTAPPYAILSHTWGEDEISFKAIQGEHSSLKGKSSFEKIENACRIAQTDGFGYIWIDTCCIDKSSSAELSEAINSMYQWYAKSGVCYALLSDVPYSTSRQAQERDIHQSRWFTRGWTLQELLAPSTVIFYSQDWRDLGTKQALIDLICDITKIHVAALTPRQTPATNGRFSGFSIAQKMSWAADRKTTREEDVAYSLMGIFDVNMPLLYGEGSMAFIRLQEEIMKRSADHTIFTWRIVDKTVPFSGGVLAPSPYAFKKSGNYIPSYGRSEPFMMTNRGINLNIPTIMPPNSPTDSVVKNVKWALLNCMHKGEHAPARHRVCLAVRWYSGREDAFERCQWDKLPLIAESVGGRGARSIYLRPFIKMQESAFNVNFVWLDWTLLRLSSFSIENSHWQSSHATQVNPEVINLEDTRAALYAIHRLRNEAGKAFMLLVKKESHDLSVSVRIGDSSGDEDLDTIYFPDLWDRFSAEKSRWHLEGWKSVDVSVRPSCFSGKVGVKIILSIVLSPETGIEDAIVRKMDEKMKK